jgi:hypothetical protein
MASVQEFFEGLAARVPADRIAGMNNTYAFDIEGAGPGRLGRRRGYRVTEGMGGGLVLATENCRSSQVNRTDDHLHDGKLKIKGDMGAAMSSEDLLTQTEFNVRRPDDLVVRFSSSGASTSWR